MDLLTLAPEQSDGQRKAALSQWDHLTAMCLDVKPPTTLYIKFFKRIDIKEQPGNVAYKSERYALRKYFKSILVPKLAQELQGAKIQTQQNGRQLSMLSWQTLVISTELQVIKNEQCNPCAGIEEEFKNSP